MIIGFGGDIRDEVIGVDRKSAYECQFVPVAPGETAVLPVQIRAIAIGDGDFGTNWVIEGHCGHHAIFGRSIRCGDVAVSSLQDQESRPRVVQIKSRHVLKLDQRLQIELKARTYRKLSRVTAVSVVLGFEIRPKHGIEL